MADIFDEVATEKKDIFDEVSAPGTDIFDKVAPSAPALPTSAFPMQGLIDEARSKDNFASRTERPFPKQPTKDEAVAAAARYALDDEALAAAIRPKSPESVTGDEITQARNKDYQTAKGYIGNAKALARLGKPNLTPKPLPAAADADATMAVKATTPPAVPEKFKEAKISAPALDIPQSADVSSKDEAKLYERAQSLVEAAPNFAKGFTTGATAGLVNPESGTEGAPGAVGRIAGNLAGGLAAGLTGPAGAPAFLMTQFLTDLEERGMDPARLADPEILALAATSGIFGGLAPVAFGRRALTRALTGAALGGGQNLAEEDIMAQITNTEPERLKSLILGGAFGAGFGLAFRDNPHVHEAVAEKLPETDVKAMDEVVAALPETQAAEPPAHTSDAPAQAAEAAPVAEATTAPTEAVKAPVAANEAAIPRTEPAAAEAPTAPADEAIAPPAAAEMSTPTAPVEPVTSEPVATPTAGGPSETVASIRKSKKAGGAPPLDPEAIVRREFTFDNWRNEVAAENDAATRKDILRVVVKSKSATEKDLSDALDALTARTPDEGPNGYIVDAGNVANDVRLSPKATDEVKARATDIYEKVMAPEGSTQESVASAPTATPSHDPSITNSHPGKPFGSTHEGIVRAPREDEPNTSARKAYTTRDRAAMGLDELPSPERRKWQDALDEAHDKNLSQGAETLASSILTEPRALTDVETAGMVRRMAELKNQHEAALDKLAELNDAVGIAEQGRALKDIEDKFDLVSRAVRASGTEKGRNLASQKLTLNRNYDLVTVLTRAKAAKGGVISEKVKAKFEEITKTLKDTEKRLADAEARIRDLRARDAIKERSTTGTRRPKQEVKAQIADLTEKTRRLLRAGCLTS